MWNAIWLAACAPGTVRPSQTWRPSTARGSSSLRSGISGTGKMPEEVAQDVLLKVYRKIEAFRGDAALSSWIYRITFNTAMSRLAQRTRASRAAETTPPDMHGDGPESTPAEPADWSDLLTIKSCAARCAVSSSARCSTLPAVYRVPVLLRGHPRPVDRGSQRHPACEAADAEVTAAPRTPDPAEASWTFRGRLGAPFARRSELSRANPSILQRPNSQRPINAQRPTPKTPKVRSEGVKLKLQLLRLGVLGVDRLIGRWDVTKELTVTVVHSRTPCVHVC